jgi:hypothetical protein
MIRRTIPWHRPLPRHHRLLPPRFSIHVQESNRYGRKVATLIDQRDLPEVNLAMVQWGQASSIGAIAATPAILRRSGPREGRDSASGASLRSINGGGIISVSDHSRCAPTIGVFLDVRLHPR